MPDFTGAAGRRDNGLSASDWGALVDLDPRLSEGLLDRLAAAGVAAYVEPASAVDTLHRGVTLPSRPLDRLWVDPSRADSAREVVAGEVADLTALLAETDPDATVHGLVQPVPRASARRVLPPPALPSSPGTSYPTGSGGPADQPADPSGPVDRADDPPAPTSAPEQPALSDEDVFAQIVAGFHRDPEGPEPRWPAAEDLPGAPPAPPGLQAPRSAAPPPERPERRRGSRGAALPPPSLPGWLEPDALEDEGHYVPPPPPPVPRVRWRTVASVAAVLLGLVVLFAPGVVGLPDSHSYGVAGLALLGGGAAALVWWMRDGNDDGGPGDGAVV